MKEVFYIKDSIENKISYYHLLFFLMALPFDRFYSSIILVSFLVHTLIFISKKNLHFIDKDTLILQSVFILSLISVIYSPSVSASLNVISNQLALLLFPFLLTVTSLDLSKVSFTSFAGAYLIVHAYSAIFIFRRFPYIIILSPASEGYFFRAFVNHNFSLPINMHATYLSMLLVLCTIYSLYQLFHKQSKFKRIYFISSSLILLAGLIQLSSKSAFITLLIIIIIGFPWFLISNIKRHQYLFISLVGSVLLINFILSFQVFRFRFLETLKNDLSENSAIVEKYGRADRWHAAWDLIKQSPVIGTGTGSEIPLLRNIYFEKKMYGSYLLSLNAHNQYLSFTINSGVVGLVIYLATIGWGFWQSIKRKDIMLFSFLALITVVSFSEDLLDVNKGIFIYAFFFPFFIRSGNRPDA